MSKTAVTFDTPSPLFPEIFSLHGKWKGAKPALVVENEILTWSEFDAKTNRVANGLSAIGLGRGDAVAVVMSNGREMVEVLIGVMKAGCVSVPLNLTVSDEALMMLMEDACVHAIIATQNEAHRLSPLVGNLNEKSRRNLVAIESDKDEWLDYEIWAGDQSDQAPGLALRPNDPMNIIYSSGTTGRPKGILHSHGGRLRWAYDLSITLRYHGAVRTLCTLGLYSNISWVLMLCTFLSGGTLFVQRKFDAQSCLEEIEKNKITHTALVPLQYQRILEAPGFANSDRSNMQAMMSCGSPLHADLKAKIFEAFPCGVIELYGLTEGIITTLDPEDAPSHLSSVGKPLIGTDIKIIDDADKEVTQGEAGEIVSRGPIMMPGYHNRPDATRDAMWIDDKGRQWLRSGDIGTLDDEGFLTIVDRKKDMILSGGQNIYPADIEAVLITHEDVSEAAIIGVSDKTWGETPFALVVPVDKPYADAQSIKEWLNAHVGKRQRVSEVVILKELPRNANGKILKRELRKRFGTSA